MSNASTEEIRAALAKVSQALMVAGDKGPKPDQPATAVLREGIGFQVTGPSGQLLQTDMPATLGGSGAGPGPGWLLRAAVASCLGSAIVMRAASLGVALDTLEVRVESASDHRGMLGIGDVPPGPHAVRMAVRIGAAGAGAEQLREIVRWADAHSPVGSTLRDPPKLALDIDVV